MLKQTKEFFLSIPLQRTMMMFITLTVFLFFLASSSYLNNTLGGIVRESETYHSDVIFSEIIAPKVAMWEFLSGTNKAMLEEQLREIMRSQKLSFIAFTSADNSLHVTVEAADYRPSNPSMIRHTRSITDPTKTDRIIGTLEIAYVNTHFQKLQDTYRFFLLILAPFLGILIYLELLLLRNLLTPLKRIADTIRSYRPGDKMELHRFLRSKNDEINEIANGFMQMQENIDQAMAEREAEIERGKQKDKILMQQSRFVEMGTMIQNIAHQWKQPLNIIELAITKLTLQRMTGNLNGASEQEVYDEIHRQVSYMSRTIDTFKSFLEEDRDNEANSPFSIAEAVDTALILVESTMIKEKITVNLRLDDRCCAHGNPKAFEQALLSLLHNAVDAIMENPYDKDHRNITISSRVENEENIIAIEDTGGGFDPELTETMFNAYVTTKHMSQGTGLGLFITKTILEMKMRGHIEAKNGVLGARFIIRLPYNEGCNSGVSIPPAR